MARRGETDMANRLLATVTGVLLLGGTAFAQGDRRDFEVFSDIAKEVRSYAHYSVFDDVSASVDEGVVTLEGKVTMPYKRSDIVKRVERIEGVVRVNNRIDVLPVSTFDDELRYRIARAIYGNPNFWNYAAMVNPPIHIVVERGHVTLTGVVQSQVERILARSLASSFGAFSVKNELRTDAEMKALLEKAD
jgi:osmotically-inducible protein OsmY